MQARQYDRLSRLLSCPTAPFREEHVVAEVESQLHAGKVPYCFDRHGNIVVGVASLQAYRQLLNSRGREPVRVFIAHMDHPGFHGVRWLGPRRLAVRWLGGSPTRHLAGRRVWLSDGADGRFSGVLRKVKLRKDRRALATAEVQLDSDCLPAKRPAAKQLFGGFDFRAPLWKSGRRLYTRAADDLCGVFAIIETARAMQRGKRKRPFIGLLTRGEEVGFVGAVAHLESSPLARTTRPIMAISLEASRTLPGAIIGKGPVVRLGDWRTVFNPDGLKVLADLAEKVLPGKHQRRVMDGGSCEATAMTAWGIPTVGISLPLGNYHNEGYEGGMDCPAERGPAPEFVHLDDIEGELVLCKALMRDKLPWQDPWQATRKRLVKNAGKYKL